MIKLALLMITLIASLVTVVGVSVQILALTVDGQDGRSSQARDATGDTE